MIADPVKIPVGSSGIVALVSPEDEHRVRIYNWQVVRTAGLMYARAWLDRKNRKRIYLHRLILGALDGQTVDHANGDTLDNTRQNLRLCTQRQNTVNRKRPKGASSPYRGVEQNICGGWRARITDNYRHVNLGTFRTAEEAARAYDKAAVRISGEFARLNFPEDRE